MVASVAGYSTPLSILLGSIGSMGLAYVIAIYARRYAGAGAIFEYLSQAVHNSFGIFSGSQLGVHPGYDICVAPHGTGTWQGPLFAGAGRIAGLEVLRLVAEGLANAEIAARLVIAVSTVKVHARAIYGKLGVNSRTQAIAQAHNLGLLSSR